MPPVRPKPVQNPLNYRAPKPSYWLICIIDEGGNIYHSRWPDHKCLTPVEAYRNAYGGSGRPSHHVLFFDLGPNITEARKLNRAVAFHQQSYGKSWKEDQHDPAI